MFYSFCFQLQLFDRIGRIESLFLQLDKKFSDFRNLMSGSAAPAKQPISPPNQQIFVILGLLH
jgi:hypothetical protein